MLAMELILSIVCLLIVAQLIRVSFFRFRIRDAHLKLEGRMHEPQKDSHLTGFEVERNERQRPDEVLTPYEAWQILLNLHSLEFPWIYTKSLEFALFKSYAIPSISKILALTKEFTSNIRKRYDDTDFLIRGFLECFIDSPIGKVSISRLNEIHSHYNISNGDYLYLLTLFALEPIDWIDRFGWRKLLLIEKEAHIVYWKNVGEKMGIANIPKTLDGFRKLRDSVEETRMRFSPANKATADPTIGLLLSIIPGGKFGQALARPFVYSLLDHRLRLALGYPSPSPIYGMITEGALHIQKWIVRFFCMPQNSPCTRLPSEKCLFAMGLSGSKREGTEEELTKAGSVLLMPQFHPFNNKTYKDGFRISDLGPCSFASSREMQ
eukprot:TRINITY_DN4831_c0_g1_i1.p1 TRINITY_DN4831_c0_g1~~TRINITY_DN4831_c0_g1_i1.p1  ORF type:complete len:379 (+),score=33.04 TRINITY_DN4831_c0_g1_i1:75-1211(+)